MRRLLAHAERFADCLTAVDAVLARISALWQQAEPIPHRSRHIYHVSWRHRGKTPMRFVCSTSIADLWNELSWNEWVPADAESWSALNNILG